MARSDNLLAPPQAENCIYFIKFIISHPISLFKAKSLLLFVQYNCPPQRKNEQLFCSFSLLTKCTDKKILAILKNAP